MLQSKTVITEYFKCQGSPSDITAVCKLVKGSVPKRDLLLLEEYKDGASLREIGRAYGLSARWIRRLLCKFPEYHLAVTMKKLENDRRRKRRSSLSTMSV